MNKFDQSLGFRKNLLGRVFIKIFNGRIRKKNESEEFQFRKGERKIMQGNGSIPIKF